MYLTLSLLFLWPASSRLPVSRRLCLPDVGTSGLSRSGGAVLDVEHVELGGELAGGVVWVVRHLSFPVLSNFIINRLIPYLVSFIYFTQGFWGFWVLGRWDSLGW